MMVSKKGQQHNAPFHCVVFLFLNLLFCVNLVVFFFHLLLSPRQPKRWPVCCEIPKNACYVRPPLAFSKIIQQ